MGGFRKGGFSNNRFVLKPDVAIASEVSILSKNSLAITDFHAKKTQHVQLFENPFLEPPHSRFPTFRNPWLWNFWLGESPSVCFPYLRNPCSRNPCFLEFPPSNPYFRNSHLRNSSRIQAPLNQTPLRLPPILGRQVCRTKLPILLDSLEGRKEKNQLFWCRCTISIQWIGPSQLSCCSLRLLFYGAGKEIGLLDLP